MRVAVAYEPGKPLVLEDLPTPEIGPRDVLVRVAASGICHTDLTAIRTMAPLVPGHEACGTVEAVGPDVRRVKAGDRVLASVTPACGLCWWCVNAMSHHCDRKALRFVPRFDLPDGQKAPALCGCSSRIRPASQFWSGAPVTVPSKLDTVAVREPGPGNGSPASRSEFIPRNRRYRVRVSPWVIRTSA